MGRRALCYRLVRPRLPRCDTVARHIQRLRRSAYESPGRHETTQRKVQVLKIEIRYTAEYRYAERVTFSPHIFRVIPKVDRYLKVHRFDFRTNRNSVINWRRDIFDNEIASVFYPSPARALQVRFRLKLEIETKNAFGFLLDSRALDMP